MEQEQEKNQKEEEKPNQEEEEFDEEDEEEKDKSKNDQIIENKEPQKNEENKIEEIKTLEKKDENINPTDQEQEESSSSYILKYVRKSNEPRESAYDKELIKSKKCLYMIEFKIMKGKNEKYLLVYCHEIAAIYFDEIYEKKYSIKDLYNENRHFRIFDEVDEAKDIIDEILNNNATNNKKIFIDCQDNIFKLHIKISLLPVASSCATFCDDNPIASRLCAVDVDISRNRFPAICTSAMPCSENMPERVCAINATSCSALNPISWNAGAYCFNWLR